MADDSNTRYRRDDVYPPQRPGARSTAGAPATSNDQSPEDALAELARLIGDDDPFADFGDIASEPAPAPAAAARPAPPRPQFSAPPVERRFEDWQPGRGRRDAEPAAPREPAPPREVTRTRVTPTPEATSYRESTGLRQPTVSRDPAPRDSAPRERTTYREPTVTREPTTYRDAASPREATSFREPAAAREPTTYREPNAYREPTTYRDAQDTPTRAARPPVPPREPTSFGALRGRAEAPGWDATESQEAEAARTTVRSGYGSLARRSDPPAQEEPAHAAAQPAGRDYDDDQYDYDSEATHRRDQTHAYAASDERYQDYDDSYDPAYDEQGYMPPHGEEVYQAEPQRNRTRVALIAVAALVGLGVAATAGVVAFRSGGVGGSSTAENAPVIKADSAPSKVAGPTAANGQNGDGQKLIYDRVGGQPGQEKVVPREEQPMDVSAAAAAAAAAQPASPTEPKRVRTVAVRSDGTIMPGTAPSGAPAANGGAAPTAYAPTQNPLPAGMPAPKSVTTVAATPPNGATAPAPAAPQQQAAISPPPATPSGAYVVQVSSQKSEADAMGSFKVLQSRYPQLLGSYQATVRRADLGDKGVFYRAQVGPFASRDEANNLCSALQAQGGTCLVTRN